MSGRINFLILTNGRSGSNNIVDLVNRHPQILNYGEVLGPWNAAWRRRSLFGHGGEEPQAVRRYLDGFYDDARVFYAAQIGAVPNRLKAGKSPGLKRRGAVAAVGLKDFQLWFDRRGVGDYAIARQDLKVIGLRRDNAVRRYLSSAMLQATGRIYNVDGQKNAKAPARAKLNLSPEKFLEGLTAVAEENRRLNETLAALPDARRMVIDYVDYFSGADRMTAINNDIFAFLGVEPVEATSTHRKLNDRTLRDSIENYDEIRAAVMASPYAAAFEAAEAGG